MCVCVVCEAVREGWVCERLVCGLSVRGEWCVWGEWCVRGGVWVCEGWCVGGVEGWV